MQETIRLNMYEIFIDFFVAEKNIVWIFLSFQMFYKPSPADDNSCVIKPNA